MPCFWCSVYPLGPKKDSGLFGVLPPPPAHNRASSPASSNSIPHACIKRPLGLGAPRGPPSPGPGRCPRGVYHLAAPPLPAHPSGPGEPRLPFSPLATLHPPVKAGNFHLGIPRPQLRSAGCGRGAEQSRRGGPQKRPVWGCLSSGRLSFAHSPSAALPAGTPDGASRPPATPSLRPGGALGGSQSPPSPAPEWGPAPAPAPAAAAAAAPLVSALRAPQPPGRAVPPPAPAAGLPAPRGLPDTCGGTDSLDGRGESPGPLQASAEAHEGFH
ncbi:skin secretory protein xP2-like [Petaurus breviceps papuanus]|uniref:skin secretory protein xP2-like n=1 Tax=Petaurus breviceps papuanus TaxID=3040969 RepID=UPI0036DE137E